MSAPDTPAVTPGQAAEIPAAFGGWVRMQFPSEIELPKNEIAGRWKYMTGPAEREFWREVETALAARQPQTAPGAVAPDRPNAKFSEWLQSHDAQFGGNPTHEYGGGDMRDAYEAGMVAAVVAYAGRPDLGEQPAPEPDAAFPAAKATLARVLSWFKPEDKFDSYRYARATRAQLASACKDGELDVPEELRRYL